jgi:hypothetical protein
VKRVLRKIYPGDLIKVSELIGDFRGGDLDPKVVLDGIWDTLLYKSPKWPWKSYGLVIDESRKAIAVLNPEVMQYILVDDIEELRLMEYVPEGYGGNPIPILIVKKVAIENPRQELDRYIKYIVRPDLKNSPRRLTLDEGLCRRIRRMMEIEWFGAPLTVVDNVGDQEDVSPKETQEAFNALFSRVFNGLLQYGRRGGLKDKDSKDEDSPI